LNITWEDIYNLAKCFGGCADEALKLSLDPS